MPGCSQARERNRGRWTLAPLLGVIGLLGILLTGCALWFSEDPSHPNAMPGGASGPTDRGGTEDDAEAAIRVGVLMPSPDAPALPNRYLNALRGAELALTRQEEVLNGLSVELEFSEQLHAGLDSNLGNPEAEVLAAQDLLLQRQIHALIGGLHARSAHAVAAWAEASRIPFFSPLASDEMLTRNRSFSFRVIASQQDQARAMARFARETWRAETAYAVYDVRFPERRTMAETFLNRFRQLGGASHGIEAITVGNQTDWSRILADIAEKESQVVYLSMGAALAGDFARAAQETGLTVRYLGPEDWGEGALAEQGGDSVRGSAFPRAYHPDRPDERNRSFVDAFRATFGVEPDDAAALYYDTVMLLFDSLNYAQESEGLDPRDLPYTRTVLRDSLKEPRFVSGVTGGWELRSEGDPRKQSIVVELAPGEEGRDLVERYVGETSP